MLWLAIALTAGILCYVALGALSDHEPFFLRVIWAGAAAGAVLLARRAH